MVLKEKKRMFKGLSIENFWLPFTANLIEASNMAMLMSNGEDIMYVKCMALCHDLMLPLYVDSKAIDINTFNRMFHVFIYVFEFIYGVKNCKENYVKGTIKVEDFFDNIKKNWNKDIAKKVYK